MFIDQNMNRKQVLAMVDELLFIDFFRYMIDALAEDQDIHKYNKLCNNAFPGE